MMIPDPRVSRRRRIALTLAVAAGAGVAAALGAASPVPAEPVARFWTWYAGGDYLDRDGVRLQHGAWDCGVSVLAMILEHHQLVPELDGVRLQVLDRGRGLSLLEMQALAQERGLHATGWRLDLQGLARTRLPAVAHFEDHYVVVDRVASDGTVRIRDPAVGRLELPREGFERLWTGNVLLFGPVPSRSSQ